MHINIKWISIFLFMLVATVIAENTNNEELVQLFLEGKGASEMIERIKENNPEQNKELGNLFLKHWKESSDKGLVKERCLQGLRLVKSQEAVDYFIEQLFEGKTRTDRVLAAHRLGTLRNASAVSALESAVSADKGVFGEGRSIAAEAISALGEIGEPAVPSLMRIWGDERLVSGCKERVMTAMGRTKDKRFTPVLIEVLKGKNELIRSNAAWALGEIGDDTSIPTLRKYQEDPNAKVRENVLQVISKIERNKLIGNTSQQTTNQTAVVVPQIPGSGKTNNLGTSGK